ncbi:MAG TPA: protein translocase subunit SecF [Candidatus Paceibacterota bacterium]|nr:protein translocase subunit SecF [Candidatus Paceibacterota bacterium]
MNILRLGKIFLALSVVLVGASIVSLAWFGLELGIEFTGGSLLEVRYSQDRPSNAQIQEWLAPLGVQVSSVQPVGANNVLLRMQDLPEEKHQEVLSALEQGRPQAVVDEQRFESIGPVIGRELTEKSLTLTLVSLLAITLYVTFAFRKVRKPARSWQWSLVALLALVHDVVIPLGTVAFLGHFQGMQITIPVMVALLTIVGYSINDTVVIFDRIRENLLKKTGDSFAHTVAKSLRQTFSRSFNTSFTTLLAVVAIYFFGGATLQPFALTLIVGMVAGTWSSLFLAPVILVKWAGKGAS